MKKCRHGNSLTFAPVKYMLKGLGKYSSSYILQSPIEKPKAYGQSVRLCLIGDILIGKQAVTTKLQPLDIRLEIKTIINEQVEEILLQSRFSK